jgi:RNA polymerase sigma-70 factor (ECF subfamily)
MPETDPRDDAPQAEQVLRLWVRNQADVSRYVYSLLPNAADVQDVLQATCVALWKKAAELDLQRPFLPLAFRFALLEVRKHREKNRRWATLVDDATLEVLAQERDSSLELLERRRQALDGCLGKLGTRDAELLERFYRKQMTVPEIAAATGRNLHTLYKALQRIRRQLHDCIDGRLRAEGSA